MKQESSIIDNKYNNRCWRIKIGKCMTLNNRQNKIDNSIKSKLLDINKMNSRDEKWNRKRSNIIYKN